MMCHSFRLLLAALLLSCCAPALRSAPVQPIFSRVPEGGIQPQVVSDHNGTAHLLFFNGDPKAGDLFYCTRPADAHAFSAPLRVNSEPGSAIAIGAIRGGQMALGRSGMVHVVWNGHTPAKNHPGSALYYTRLDPQRQGFEPQRDLMNATGGLDGGGSVAADAEGHVFAAWHGTAREGDTEGNRAVYLAVSADDGRSFAPERRISPEGTGACGCCGLKIHAAKDRLYLIYRAAAGGGSDRHERLLASGDLGKTFSTVMTHSWSATTCPMSSASFASEPSGSVLAWENRGKVWLCSLNDKGERAGEPISPAGLGQKYPIAVTAPDGARLLVWIEGAGWQKAGALCWQVFDAQNKAIASPVRTNNVPVWSFAGALLRAGKTFEIIY